MTPEKEIEMFEKVGKIMDTHNTLFKEVLAEIQATQEDVKMMAKKMIAQELNDIQN